MYIAVCDDDTGALGAVDALLAEWETERRLPLRRRLFSGCAELLGSARRDGFTLYLLDVLMPGISGIDAAREIRDFDRAAEIVFLTSSPEFAYDSYRVQALDYLLKPVDREQLFPLLDRLYLREQRSDEALTLKSGITLIRVPFSHISFVEVIGKRLYFNLANGEVREVAGAMKAYEQPLLSRPEFMRVHRSYIVNMLHAVEFSSNAIRTFSGRSVPVSRLLYPQLQKAYMNLLFEEGGRR